MNDHDYYTLGRRDRLEGLDARPCPSSNRHHADAYKRGYADAGRPIRGYCEFCGDPVRTQGDNCCRVCAGEGGAA